MFRKLHVSDSGNTVSLSCWALDGLPHSRKTVVGLGEAGTTAEAAARVHTGWILFRAGYRGDSVLRRGQSHGSWLGFGKHSIWGQVRG